MSDPIVDEVRAYRLEHTRKFDGDLHRICEDLRAYQKVCGHKVVRFEKDKAAKPEHVQPAHEA